MLEDWEGDEQPDGLRDADSAEEEGDLDGCEAVAAEGGLGEPEYR